MDTLRAINRWVNKQAPWVDDIIHFVLGLIVFWLIFTLLYWGLPHEYIWGIRVIAFLSPIFVGALEESTNIHPDYRHDIPGYVVGSIVSLIISILII